jgi:ABC-type nitrate/sulfonate/bicarbonate transport system substrate-binding protein
MKLTLRNKPIITAIVVFAVLLFSASLFYLNSTTYYFRTSQSITIGNAQSFECDTLIHIAVEQNLFAKNGLDVTIRNYTSGLAAVNGLLNGEVDIAATAEFPLVSRAFAGTNISALATIAITELQDIICRKDRGIEQVSDLSGKKIGVTKGTIAEFYLGRFLLTNGLSSTDVTLLNVSPADSAKAITNETVDAIITWQPYAFTLEGLLGSNAVVWPAQGDQRTFIVEVAKNDWIKQHPDAVNRFLKSLNQAEQYLVEHPSQVEEMIQTKLHYSEDYMAAIWHKNTFSLSLSQSLVLAMESEARWMINNNLTNQTMLPDFVNYIYLEGLSSVKPESVNVNSWGSGNED